jgi:hypothetical protein
MKMISLRRHGKDLGAIPIEQLKRMVSAGVIDSDIEAREPGSDKWLTVGDLLNAAALGSDISAEPPAAPPATLEKIPEEQLVDVIGNEVAKIISARRGSGATVDDPCRLGAMHPLLAPMTEKLLVSSIYGQENVQWFDVGREYHKNGTICEQRVRLGDRVNPKPAWAQPGKTYSVFFDISELTHEAPIPDAVKQLLMKGALQMPPPDTTLVSRFPLIEVRAKNAVEAAREIRGHLKAAEAEGWTLGSGTALVDNWRNEYELTKGSEKTVMQFDMRPCLLSDSPMNLTVLTLMAVNPKFEDAVRKFEGSAQPRDSSNRISGPVTRDRLSDDTIERITPLVVLVAIVFSVFSALAVTRILNSPLAGVVTFFVAFFIWLRIFAWIVVTVAHRFYAWRRKRIGPSSH